MSLYIYIICYMFAIYKLYRMVWLWTQKKMWKALTVSNFNNKHIKVMFFFMYVMYVGCMFGKMRKLFHNNWA